MTYQVVETKHGERWLRDNRFVPADSVPEGEKRIIFNTCFMGSEKGSHKRMLNGRMIPLCDEHYFQATLGRVAQAARELGL